jgi:superoxide dismutase
MTCVANGPVWAVSLPYHVLSVPAEVYILPILPYDNGGLEPYITREMLETHYEGHHDAYRRKMNAALTCMAGRRKYVVAEFQLITEATQCSTLDFFNVNDCY